jgi:hypothetical protein
MVIVESNMELELSIHMNLRMIRNNILDHVVLK